MLLTSDTASALTASVDTSIYKRNHVVSSGNAWPCRSRLSRSYLAAATPEMIQVPAELVVSASVAGREGIMAQEQL
jgi:hypothetical protein